MEVRRCVLDILVVALAVATSVLIQCGLAQRVPVLSSAIERSALLDLRSSLGLRGWDWPIKSDPCSSWGGVQCENGQVTGINVSGLKRTRKGRIDPKFSVDTLANLTLLASFNASGFSLPGSIPDWFGTRLGLLRVLDLRFCSISGSIPVSVGSLSRLGSLFLSDNNLTGGIPVALGHLKELRVLDLSRNSLTGSIPSSFSNLMNISRLELASNYLSGSTPADLGSLSNLQFLNLSDNSFTGSVPSQFGNLLRLIELDLSKNSLSGSLPVELKALKSLRKLLLGDNELEAPLPDDFFNSLVQLQVVDLSRNKLDGALPGAFWLVPGLQFLDLSRNNFTGLLPNFSLNINASGFMFNLSNNFLYGSLNSDFSRFKWIDLLGNYFQGEMIDDSLSNTTLDKNCLQATLNQRSLDDCNLFYKARGLTFDNFGVPVTTPLPPEEERESNTKGRNKQWIFILLGVLGGLGFIVILVLLIVLLMKMCGNGNLNQNGSMSVGPIPQVGSNLSKDPITFLGLGQSFTYDQLLNATGGFNQTNLIKHGHSGDLFRGSLENGAPVVVKRIGLSSSDRESYRMELEVFGRVSHTRLVPLLGHCLEKENEKLLVYKHMPNGDLASSFYRVSCSEDDSLKSLDWITRLKIAIGTAEVLSYLHHECSPPLVHRDVQASSILLDDKFEVCLGSLSAVRAQEGDSHKNVFTRLLWKQQTSEAVPSASSSSTCSYDIYSFGKVLLGLVTGKIGTMTSEDASIKEWLEQTPTYISPYDKEPVSKILDPSLIVDDDLLEEVWAMAIVAKSCLNPKPSKRPPMKYVLKALENPMRVVRAESFNSARLRSTSSRRSWTQAFFGSW